MSESGTCAACGASVPKTQLAWTSAGEVCAACERKPRTRERIEAAQEDPNVVPPSPFRDIPLRIFSTIAAVFVVGGVVVGLGVIFGFQLSIKGAPIPTTWEAAGGFVGSGIVSGLIAVLIVRFTRPKS